MVWVALLGAAVEEGLEPGEAVMLPRRLERMTNLRCKG